MATPTEELYRALQGAYEHFNISLFSNTLPAVLFTTQRQKGMMGCFFANRWASSGHKKRKCHEIAINPLYVGKATLIELMQTLVHEMVHCWQYCYGKPSRGGYHNREWSNKMIEIGLMPSSTGKPGGKVVGQNMADYPSPSGDFIKQCIKLLEYKKFNLPWIDRYSSPQGMPDQQFLDNNEDIKEALAHTPVSIVTQLTTNMSTMLTDKIKLPPVSNAKVKLKYTCSGCYINVWGKPGLALRCEDCDISLRVGVACVVSQEPGKACDETERSPAFCIA